jgi:enoyl-CoA hydratase
MTIHESVSDDGVLELVMDNPKVNALPIADTHRIAEVLDGVRHRPEITAVIVTATGRGFCAGVDIKEMQALPGNDGILGVNQACFDAFRSVYECAVPVIAAVQDFCLGLGIGLAGNADLVVAAEGVKFAMPEVDNGALGAATHTSRLVPEKVMRHMIYTCEPVTAEQLHAWGSVWEVVAADDLMATAQQLAHTIASKSGPVIRKAKWSLNGIDPVDVHRSYRFEQGFTYELNLMGEGDKARDAFIAGERDSNRAAD